MASASRTSFRDIHTTSRIPAHTIHERKTETVYAKLPMSSWIRQWSVRGKHQDSSRRADTKPLITRVKQHCPAQGTHAATQTQLAQSFLLQNSTSASYNLTGQRDMLVGHQLPPEHAAFNSVSPSASHILMLIVSHQPPWLSTWC